MHETTNHQVLCMYYVLTQYPGLPSVYMFNMYNMFSCETKNKLGEEQLHVYISLDFLHFFLKGKKTPLEGRSARE